MRGFWHIIEAVIAGLMIMLFLVTLVKQAPSEEGPDLTRRAFELLRGLDDQEALRGLVESEDANGLAAAVQYAAANRSVEICDHSGACVGTQPSAAERWTGTYLVAGKDSYEPKEVRLYLVP